ncbi:group II intron maturase-specific domain protein [Candidatus Symbiobacter mobilis CR]|uniref:Group II intron maturase-specific domain protein n=1 Tax=Candidatus Symbiobacter mobilis CR TaxID=946483 RepID=U5N4P3_9BURK|nr:group II intron maturase-specific domain protein [Candidatus Symbiobacter mobilis CR]
MQSITRYLETILQLQVNLAQSKMAPMSECAFLGFTIKGKKIRCLELRSRYRRYRYEKHLFQNI